MKIKIASRQLQLISAALSVALVLVPVVRAQRQGDRILKAEEVKQLPSKAKRFALVIGVDEYQDTQISRLSGATNDAKALADALMRYAGFPRDQVILLASDQPQERQPTRGNILRRLSNLRGLVPPDGLLLLSFAGHGIERGGRGFLCTADAQLNGDLALLEDTAISVETMHERIRQMGVKQVVIILDACRNDPSGRGEGENRLTDSFAQKFNFDVRNKEVTAFATLYATDVGHVAYEYKEQHQGYFTWMLVEGLKGGAANERGEVTLGSLVKYLQEQVPKQVGLDLGQEKSQRPYAKTEGYKADELVISITAVSTLDKPTLPVDSGANEREFWSSIKGSSDPDDFREYLKKFPDGQFAGLARNKIKSLAEMSPSTSRPSSAQPSAAGIGSNLTHLVDMKINTQTLKGIAIETMLVPEGRFLMGSPEDEAGRSDDEGPQHEVTLSSFYMGKYEVTQALWRVVAQLPKVNIDLDPDPSHFKGDDLPVEQVSWDEAVEFCARLSKATGEVYRLPTEAEWEYAARAMTTKPVVLKRHDGPRTMWECTITTGPYAGDIDKLAWYGDNSGRMTHTVGKKQPNGFGLCDMYGNVWEWCLDRYKDTYFGQGSSVNPTGPDTGSRRVIRGGCWILPRELFRSAHREGSPTGMRSMFLGFRLVKPLK